MVSYILLILFSVVALIAGQMVTDTDTLTMINLSFFWGLISIMVGACCYIFQTGFLDLFLEGFKKIAAVTVPKSRSLERVDKQLKEDAFLRSWKQSIFTKAKILFLGIGSGMTLFSFTIMLFV
ncbi:DUF3899 domain-containing protein [Pseudalkalibacillus decolorationis]|uniref:DUF3899 domain-containing protein n=1 Tax=Pseudalkalibacillus decolorationis TaxID=163879 RepID=UPI002148FB27|nr:DUF3899 domain-containing protein [Pseudalkalibacillus decolorationis]